MTNTTPQVEKEFYMENSILEKAGVKENWLAFLEYKLDKQHLSGQEERDIRDFITRKAYLPLCEQWADEQFPKCLPVKRVVNKQGSTKKRIVYSFPGDEGIMLKFIAFHLFDFDSYFCDNCYAFRRQFGVKDAIRRIRQTRGLSDMYCLKVDISNYFNTIDVAILLEKLRFVEDADPTLYRLFTRILKEKHVLENDTIVTENHGAMAGTPISPFFANVYLQDVDAYFADQNILYFRYSDDILLFADSLTELEAYQNTLYEKISALGLSLNPDKVHISAPGEEWEFLGFCYRNGEIDLSHVTIRKMKAKIKRKAEALRRWQRKKGLSGEKAAIGLIRAMNRKFYGSVPDSAVSSEKAEEGGISDEFTWSRWFFPNLTVDTGLKTIDAYLQQYIRYTVTGRHYKGNYRIRYETLKEWGYRSLVHEYYKVK